MKTNAILMACAALLLVAGACQHNDPLSETGGGDSQVVTSEVDFSPEELRLLAELSKGTPRVSEDEAIERALEAADMFYGPATAGGMAKSVRQRTVQRPIALTLGGGTARGGASLARSVDGEGQGGEPTLPDTVAYIINFGDDEGGAIVAADERIPDQVLAVIGSGSFGQETDNPGLAIFLEGAELYIKESIAKAEAERDSLMREVEEKEKVGVAEQRGVSAKAVKPVNRIDFQEMPKEEEIKTTYSYDSWEHTWEVAPLTAVEWNQGNSESDLYNKFVRHKGCDGKAYFTGCVPVAAAQIMAYWKHPATVDGYNMDWNNMVLYTHDYSRGSMFNWKWKGSLRWGADDKVKDNVARLMERIGANIGTTYGCESSSSNSQKAIDWLRRVGYSGGDKYGYDYQRVKGSLSNKRIVYATGCSSMKNTRFLGIVVSTEYSGCHAWNFDGCFDGKQKVTRTTTKRWLGEQLPYSTQTVISYKYESFVHVNWGWGGNSNGYYISGAFNSNNGPTITSRGNTVSTKGDQPYYYQYRLDIYTDIRR